MEKKEKKTMAEAKITLTTEVKNEGLEKLNKALAEGQQSVESMTRELKDLKKATQDGTQATKEQADAMVKLRQDINAQKAVNKEYSKEISLTTSEIKKSVKAMADGDKGARALAGAFKATEGFTTALSVAMGGLAATIATAAASALADMASQVATLGAQMQQSVAQMAVMTGGVNSATEAYRALNDAYRNTNFQEEAVYNMGQQLMRMGYSAQSAADLIQLCADAAAGLGTGQAGAQQLVDALARMQAVGELTNKQMVSLKMAGVDMDAAFKGLGMTGEQAMKAVEDGTIDSQKAIAALTNYLHQYDGKMAESKNNTIDAWGDVTGNLTTMCAEIGNGIFDAFNQSEIVQKLIDFTQSLVDMVRGEGCGAFSDLRTVADEVLSFIGGLLGFVLDTVKLIIVAVNDAYGAFKNFGAQVVEAIRPAVDAVMTLYDAVKAVMSSVGAAFHSEVAKSVSATFGREIDPEERSKAVGYIDVPKQRSGTATSTGGRSGGGGSAKAAMTEEEKAIEAVIKKYADAEKQKWNLAKTTQELAKVSAAMLVGENKETEEKRIKLQALSDAHEQLLQGYTNELNLAQQIKDADVRDKTIQSINDQIAAENQLYEARAKAVEFQANYKDLQEESKSILEQVFGDPDDVKAKINKIKEDLVASMQEVDAAVANPNEEEAINSLAKLLNMAPEALAEELALKGQSIKDFAADYKNSLAEAAAAETNSIKTAGAWHDYLKSYAVDVGKSMGNAMTEWIMGEKTAGEAMRDFAKNIIQNAVNLLAQWMSLFAIFCISGDPAGAAKAATQALFGFGGKTGSATKSGVSIGASASRGVYGLATGGYILGPGTGTSDSVPALLSHGEYVLRSSAVDRIGVGTLNAMNAGAVPHFADGGSVDDVVTGGDVINNVTLQVSALDARSFDDFLDRGGLDSIRQALYENNRRFGTEVGVW